MKSAPRVLVCCAWLFCTGQARALDRIITTRAGYDLGDGRPSSQALLGNPTGVAFDAQGNFYYSDVSLQEIRRVDARTGIITAIAGSGEMSESSSTQDIGDDGPPLKAKMFGPYSFAFDANGILYFSDFFNMRIRAVNFGPFPAMVCNVLIPANRIETIAGDGNWNGVGGVGDNGPATSAEFSAPRGIALDSSGNVYLAAIDEGRVRRIDARTGIITTFAGTGGCGTGAASGDGGDAAAAPVCLPTAMTFDPQGNMFLASWTYSPDFSVQAGTIRKINPRGKISTYAGNGVDSSGGDGMRAVLAGLGTNPDGLALDSYGNLFISTPDDNRIRRVDAKSGIIETVAGGGPPGFWSFSGSDNGKSPLTAFLQAPTDLVVHNNRVYFADQGSGVIRYIQPGKSGIVTGAPDEILEEAFGRAGMKAPFSAAIDAEDNVYIDGYQHPAIYKVDRTGAVSIFADASDSFGDTGDGGRALDATFGNGYLAFDESKDHLYYSDVLLNVIRRINAVPVPGHGKLIAPASTIDFIAATPFTPGAMAIVGSTMYVTEFFGSTVWTVDLTNNTFALYAGAEGNFSDTDGSISQATFNGVNGIVYDGARGALYVGDTGNSAVRKIDIASGTVSTLLTLPPNPNAAYCGQDCLPTPSFVTLSGDYLFFDDDDDNVVYRVDLTSPVPAPVAIAGAGNANGYPAGFTGDQVLGPESQLNPPEGLVVDSSGRLQIVDTRDQRLRALGLVDILPGEYPNRISLGNHGVIQVAIRATYDFDPLGLDPRTITVAGAPVSTSCGSPDVWAADIDGDGRLDLVFNVSVDKLQLTPADKEAAVLASSYSGQPFADADYVIVTH